jgi:hypothetical protein
MGFAAVVYLSEAQNPIPPPPYTLYKVRGWRVDQREVERGSISQSWVENTNITDCIHQPLKMTTFCFGAYIVN